MKVNFEIINYGISIYLLKDVPKRYPIVQSKLAKNFQSRHHAG